MMKLVGRFIITLSNTHPTPQFSFYFSLLVTPYHLSHISLVSHLSLFLSRCIHPLDVHATFFKKKT